MDSWYGDLTNAGSAEGGLVKSALFLREFVTVPWVHLDIAGTAYFRKATPYAAARRHRRVPRDARGAGARRRPRRLTGASAVPGAAVAASSRSPMEPLSALLGRGGFVLGLAADRLATRWPEHDEEHPPGARSTGGPRRRH